MRKDAEYRGQVFKQAGEHGLAALQLRHRRGEGGQSGSSEPTPYPDRVPRHTGRQRLVQVCKRVVGEVNQFESASLRRPASSITLGLHPYRSTRRHPSAERSLPLEGSLSRKAY
jgi:hypothetical protein